MWYRTLDEVKWMHSVNWVGSSCRFWCRFYHLYLISQVWQILEIKLKSTSGFYPSYITLFQQQFEESPIFLGVGGGKEGGHCWVKFRSKQFGVYNTAKYLYEVLNNRIGCFEFIDCYPELIDRYPEIIDGCPE